MRDGYAVTVEKNGEPILMIGTDLSGKAELSNEDVQAIRIAGEHLIAFAGPDEPQPCFACGGVDECQHDCPLNR